MWQPQRHNIISNTSNSISSKLTAWVELRAREIPGIQAGIPLISVRAISLSTDDKRKPEIVFLVKLIKHNYDLSSFSNANDFDEGENMN